MQAQVVTVKRSAVLGLRVGRRVQGQGHRRGRSTRRMPAHIEKRAIGIAQGVVTPARDVHSLKAAPASAIGTQRHAIAVVGQQQSRLQSLRAGQHIAHHCRIGLGWAAAPQRLGLQQARHFARYALLQQRPHRLQQPLAHGPALRRTVKQHVGQCHDAHALVVRHEGLHADERTALDLPLGRVVQRLDKAHVAARLQALKPTQIFDSAAGIEHGRQHTGIGRNHQFIGRRAAQGQSRHALRGVLVGQRVVARRIRRLGNAPGHAVLARKRLLLLHCRARGALQRTADRLGHHQCRHQVLKHRPRPRAQADTAVNGIKRPAQGRPVRHRHIALGNGPQAGQTRLGRQQVIEIFVQFGRIHPVANMKKAPAQAVQKAKLGFHGPAL